MTIRAKYPSICDTCGGRIREGDFIHWMRGLPAVHESCQAFQRHGYAKATPAEREAIDARRQAEREANDVAC